MGDSQVQYPGFGHNTDVELYEKHVALLAKRALAHWLTYGRYTVGTPRGSGEFHALARREATSSPVLSDARGQLRALSLSPNAEKIFLQGEFNAWSQILFQAAVRALEMDIIDAATRLDAAQASELRALGKEAERVRAWPEWAHVGQPIQRMGSVYLHRIRVSSPMKRLRAVLSLPEVVGGPCPEGLALLLKWAGVACVEELTERDMYKALASAVRPTDFTNPRKVDVDWFLDNLCPPNAVEALRAEVNRIIVDGPSKDTTGLRYAFILEGRAAFEFYEERTDYVVPDAPAVVQMEPRGAPAADSATDAVTGAETGAATEAKTEVSDG